MRKLLVAVFTAVLVMGLAGPAFAHVTVQPREAVVGSFSRFVVRVPNERDDASTIKVEVELPDLFFVSFQDAPGWKRTIEMRELDEPAEVFGEEVTEVVGTVTWQGGEVQPGEFTEFGFSARMPEEETTLEFPAIQTYDSGEVVRWIGPPDSEEPAALVKVWSLGEGEEQPGQLELLAQLVREQQAGEETEEDGGGGSGVLLGWAGIVMGAIALVVALVRRR